MRLNNSTEYAENDGLELNLDNHACVEVEAALSNYRSMELVEACEREKTAARKIHSRLKQAYTFGAGAILVLETQTEAQTLLNAIAYYNPPVEHLFKKRYCERITEELHEHSSANVVNIITPDDVDSNVTVSVPSASGRQQADNASPCSMDVGVSSQQLE